MAKRDDQLLAAYHARAAAVRELDAATKAAFPAGRRIEWIAASRRQRGVVTTTSFDCVKVRNERTGREYWIHLWRIVDVMEGRG